MTKNLNHETTSVRFFHWLKLLLIGLIIETIFRERLYSWGMKMIEVLQHEIADNELTIQTLQALSFIANKQLIMMVILLSFNFLDMYTTLVIAGLGISSGIGTGFFKLIYKNPRPFFHAHWVKVYDCETGYGNPSGHSIVAVSFYLTLWKVLRKRVPFIERHKNKFGVFLFVFILSILMSRLALGAHSLNQVIFGTFIGYQLYSLYFYVIKIDLHLHKEIFVLLKKENFKKYLLAISIILIISFILFNFFPLNLSLEIERYLLRILEKCPGTPYSKTFDYEAYLMIASSSSLIGAYLGILFDIKYNLNNSIEKWLELNTGETLWNKTGVLKALKRLVVMILILSPPLSLDFIISYEAHTNYIFIFKNFVPCFAAIFILFAYGRYLNCWLGYGNEKIIEIIDRTKIEGNN